MTDAEKKRLEEYLAALIAQVHSLADLYLKRANEKAILSQADIVEFTKSKLIKMVDVMVAGRG